MSGQYSPNITSSGTGNAASYSAYPAMDVSTSPHPSAGHHGGVATHLTTPGGTVQPHAISTPSSPLGYQHQQYATPIGGSSPYYGAHDSNAMVVEVQQQQKRKAEGFRRVRDQRDLQPVVNTSNINRRIDHMTGDYLTVRSRCSIAGDWRVTNGRCLPAIEAVDDEPRGYVSPVQPAVPIRVVAQPTAGAHEAEQACA